jgi:CHAT domain-containing protein
LLRPLLAAGRAGWRGPAARLYEQRLAPLEKHLGRTKGLPAVRHLIVLPSPALAGVPVEALLAARPAGAAGYRVSYAPSASVLTWLRRQKRPTGPSALLALGDPTFAPAGKGGMLAALRRAGHAPLPGTRREVEGIARLFGKSKVLLGPKAGEEELGALADRGELKGYRYLHLATHGFADPSSPFASYLALADEGLPDPLPRVLKGQPAPTGRLTAADVQERWKLEADLVVLSACQSGLGRLERGEGYVGFAQAFFLAGASSLVLSQWNVDDEATALLMVRFYQNLLGKREGLKPMPKAEALQEARDWLRNLSAKEVKLAVERLPRGKGDRPVPLRKEARPFAHPYYWAAFVLVGDPR